MAYTESLIPVETTEQERTESLTEKIIEEMPTPRRDYSKHFNRFAPETIRPTAATSRKKSLLWGSILLLIGLFFVQTAFTSTFGIVGTLIYSICGVITSAAGIFRLITGFRGKADSSQQNQ